MAHEIKARHSHAGKLNKSFAKREPGLISGFCATELLWGSGRVQAREAQLIGRLYRLLQETVTIHTRRVGISGCSSLKIS